MFALNCFVSLQYGSFDFKGKEYYIEKYNDGDEKLYNGHNEIVNLFGNKYLVSYED